MTAADQIAQQVRWHGVADRDALHRAAFERVLAAAGYAVADRGRFDIVLAGGDTPRDLYHLLREAKTAWGCWRVWFGDERCLPAGDPRRNSAMAAAALLDHVPIRPSQVRAIPGELGARQAAASYAAELRGVGAFDLVLLGLGEDGHTASLFPSLMPDRDWGLAEGAPDAIPVFDAPKPPAERVTLSAARLSRARAVLFLVDGEAKRRAVSCWRAGVPLPAAAIRPAAGVDVLLTQALLTD